MTQESQPESTPTNQKSLAAREFARSGSVRRAARRSGIDAKSIKDWLKHDPDFMEEVLETRASPVIRTITALQRLCPYAVKVLGEEMKPPVKGKRGPKPKDQKYEVHKHKERTEADPRRIRAAKIVLEHLREFSEHLNMAEEIRELKTMMERNQPQRPALSPAPQAEVINVEFVGPEPQRVATPFISPDTD